MVRTTSHPAGSSDSGSCCLQGSATGRPREPGPGPRARLTAATGLVALALLGWLAPTAQAGTATSVATVGVQNPTQQHVTKAYSDLFNRAPDPEGLQNWSVALRSGTPRIAVATPSAIVDITLPHSWVRVPRSFLGFSIETWNLRRFAGPDPSKPFSSTLNLLNNLNPTGNSPVEIRIGGGSADRSVWNPLHAPRPPGPTFDLDEKWMSTLKSLTLATGARARVTLNLAQDNPQTAIDEARAIVDRLPGKNLAGLELGNEPDLYGTQHFDGPNGAPVRQPGYGLASYGADASRFRAAINVAVPTAASIMSGPAFASPAWWLNNSPQLIEAAGMADFTTITWHAYATHRCGMSDGDPKLPTASALVTGRDTDLMVSRLRSIADWAHAHNRSLRLSEFNSIACGGVAGVSDSYASALWGAYSFFELAAAGVDGVDVHGGGHEDYSPVLYTRDGDRSSLAVRPLYSAMVFFATATSGADRLSPITTALPAGVSGYIITAPDGGIRLALINRSATTVSLSLPGVGRRHAKSMVLTASSLAALSGVTLGGANWDSSRDGQPNRPMTATPLKAVGGTVSTKLPLYSALLVTLT